MTPSPGKAIDSPAQDFAAWLLASLVAAGVEHIFLAPGARSQSLAIAAAQLAAAKKVQLHVRIDERSLAFTALGTALATGSPSVIITTSGTAVANLHPAVLEAHHSGVPLILLTADRPAELRGVGANQTTNQVGIFSDAVRECIDVAAPEGSVDELETATRLAVEAVHTAIGWSGSQPGPVQLNLAFREPLSSTKPNAAEIDIELPISATTPAVEPNFAVLDSTVPTVVLAGAEAGPDAVELAEAYGWPLFAEPSSGARFGANSITSYRRLLELGTPLTEQIGRVVVFGKPTLGRAAIRLLYRDDVEVVVIRSQTMGHFDVSRRAVAFADEVIVDDEVAFDWLEQWRRADAAWRETHSPSGELDRRRLIEEIWLASAADALVLGASRLIREADVWAPNQQLQVFSNRGLAGIDGTIATATGVALGLPTEVTTRALIGDITFAHDVSSLAIDPTDPPLNLQIIVGNDNGGTIFDSLEVASLADEQTFERVFKTSQSIDIWHLAQGYGWQYILVENAEHLVSALATPGRVVIEVRLT